MIGEKRVVTSCEGRYVFITGINEETYYKLFEVYNSSNPDHGADHSEKNRYMWRMERSEEELNGTYTFIGFVPKYEFDEIMAIVGEGLK
jgi:hypothetical protein